MNFSYFDLGLVTIIIQAIIAAVAGIMLLSKKTPYEIKLFCRHGEEDSDDVFKSIDVS